MKKAKSSKAIINPSLIQRGYRFDAKLYAAFEEDCAKHFSNPKRVLEALIIYWLNANPDTRAALVQKHRERIPISDPWN